ncbi:MFS transporter [Alicyclobacillus sp. ALC3]|uniref:MFS transporter n=1 Tax=Alicyclobacillus sp. ALC3 TaxID=2796143 RepID=UPI00237934A7|nr:MFS transporter [Alicyclobacillus sp. ALC3]WDL97162.1 MFS transporter [Alicyclobacillus sp. ALC3]
MDSSPCIDLLLPNEQRYLLDHFINYCQTHVFHLDGEIDDLKSRDGAYYCTSLSVMEHIKSQWQLELAWGIKVRTQMKVFITGLAIFSPGSLLCALSGDLTVGGLAHITTLNLSRAFQGLGASAMMSLSLSIISAEFHGKERGTAFGIWGGVSGLATAIRPLVGGVLVEKVNWQSIFYINVPIGIVGIALSIWANDCRKFGLAKHYS